MSNQNHSTVYLEDDFQQSGGGLWVRLVGIVVYILIIIAFAWQTLELIGWLFPSENWFMKAVTVFVCDGCATGYAMAEMFYRFKLRKSKHIVFGMWIVTFIFSTCATIVQMYLASVNLIPHKIDPSVTMIAYAIIIVAFVCNIIAITSVIRMEYNAGQPQRYYLDDTRVRRPSQVRIVEQSPSRAIVPSARAASPDEVVDPYGAKEKVDSEPKQLADRPTLTDRIWAFRDRIDQRIDDGKPITQEQSGEVRTRRVGGDPEMEQQEDLELPDNYLSWSDQQWKQAKDQLPKEQYDELFDECFADDPEPEKATPVKRTPTKKKVTRRRVK